MSGGTFTVTNLGSLGVEHFTPIVNHPEVAILGMGRAKQEAVMTEGKFQPRLKMPLSLSFDHRLVDGAEGARFLRTLVAACENPLIMFFESS
jgi:pyruvate dehydrogenase E2 component (dihydrolipoamide acetyltransferase)